MTEEYNENVEEQGIEEADAVEQESQESETAQSQQVAGKFEKVIADGEKRYKLPGMFKDWFLDYASYVMLDRAVPYIEDGLKPVQRRILHALKLNEDGKYHKVAGIVGDTMKYHPHGDASIYDALVTMQQKGLLVDGQGNWGNILTGDSAAAMRYIECKLSKFALDVVYNPKITEWVPTYDKANEEPVCFPIKFPLLLAHGTKGIGVGLKVVILPHNFNELIDASIDVLKGREVHLYPDFPTGGIVDCSKYNGGLRGGKVRIRSTIIKKDKRTLVIEDIPYGETIGSVIASIVAANENGKIKIKKIDDYSSENVNIELQLPADISPDKTIDALYAFTSCASSISVNAVVIKDRHPEFMTVEQILEYNTLHTRDLFRQELEVKLAELEESWHYSSLEKIFFENKVYRILENNASSWEEQLMQVEDEMKKYQHLVHREIVPDDILKLVEKPVRKISKFDIKAAEEKILGIEADIAAIRHNLDHLTEYTIDFFKSIKKKYGSAFPRKTKLDEFENIQAQTVVAANAKLYANRTDGFIGTDPKKLDNPEFICECSEIDDIIVFLKDGRYMVTNVKDKAFIGKNIIHLAVFKKGDERTIYNAVYRDGKGGNYYVKRFSVTAITRNKMYDITLGTPDSNVLWFTANPNGEAEVIKVYLRPRPKLKKLVDEYDFSTLVVKGRGARGNLLTKSPIQKILLKSKGVSTIGGKRLWFDADINRLNDDERGLYLGEFLQNDHILVILKNGRWYTTNFDLVNKYQGDILKIEKLDLEKIYTAIYFDKSAGCHYIKRFSFEPSDNNEQSFIGEAAGSSLYALNDDLYPQLKIEFKGKSAKREPQLLDVDEFIRKMGIKAKGRKVSTYEVGTMEFVEPLEKEPLPTDEAAMEDEEGFELTDEPVDDSAEAAETFFTATSQESVADSSDEGEESGDAIELTLF